ncbi:MAG: hypothetical protein KDD53_05145 [Bdellovibrionales bacterium]|nr:hypothetical protein [Bdellovibrionales bacterium]
MSSLETPANQNMESEFRRDVSDLSSSFASAPISDALLPKAPDMRPADITAELISIRGLASEARFGDATQRLRALSGQFKNDNAGVDLRQDPALLNAPESFRAELVNFLNSAKASSTLDQFLDRYLSERTSPGSSLDQTIKISGFGKALVDYAPNVKFTTSDGRDLTPCRENGFSVPVGAVFGPEDYRLFAEQYAFLQMETRDPTSQYYGLTIDNAAEKFHLELIKAASERDGSKSMKYIEPVVEDGELVSLRINPEHSMPNCFRDKRGIFPLMMHFDYLAQASGANPMERIDLSDSANSSCTTAASDLLSIMKTAHEVRSTAGNISSKSLDWYRDLPLVNRFFPPIHNRAVDNLVMTAVDRAGDALAYASLSKIMEHHGEKYQQLSALLESAREWSMQNPNSQLALSLVGAVVNRLATYERIYGDKVENPSVVTDESIRGVSANMRLALGTDVIDELKARSKIRDRFGV